MRPSGRLHANVSLLQYCHRFCNCDELAKHLGRVGTAAYADAMNTFRQTFSGQVRVVHGYPVFATPIIDPVTIRELVEIEAWLDTVDLRRAHLLPETSKFFKDNILASPMDQN